MLNIKSKIVIIFFIITLQPLLSNPFRGNNQEQKAPEIRNSGGQTYPYLIELQMEFREKMADLLIEIKNNRSTKALILLLTIGFLYGIVHAAGPGHRKTVLFTMFLSNKSKWWEPLIAGTISAFLHGLSGILLIIIYKNFSLHLLSSRVDSASKYLESGSFILLLLLSVILFVNKFISIFKNKNSVKVVEKSKRSYFYTILVTSLFPCPGAVLILILSLSLNVLNIGILTVIFLSIGMGITISITAYLGRAGRVGLFKTLKSKESFIDKISNYLELSGYLVLLLFSLWMLLPLFI